MDGRFERGGDRGAGGSSRPVPTVADLVDMEGLGYAEPAEEIDVPDRSVMSRLHLARARITDRLAAAGLARGGEEGGHDMGALVFRRSCSARRWSPRCSRVISMARPTTSLAGHEEETSAGEGTTSSFPAGMCRFSQTESLWSHFMAPVEGVDGLERLQQRLPHRILCVGRARHRPVGHRNHRRISRTIDVWVDAEMNDVHGNTARGSHLQQCWGAAGSAAAAARHSRTADA